MRPLTLQRVILIAVALTGLNVLAAIYDGDLLRVVVGADITVVAFYSGAHVGGA